MLPIKLYNNGMANSLFIPRELERADKNCDRIVATLQPVGEPWTQVQFMLWLPERPPLRQAGPRAPSPRSTRTINSSS
jgi:hypothetical protein